MNELNFEAFLANAANDQSRGAEAKAALAHIVASGLPNKRVETYKYTDLRALMGNAPSLFNPALDNEGESSEKAHAIAFTKEKAIVFGNGHCLTQDLPEGVSIQTLADAPLPKINEDAAGDALFQLCSGLPIECHEITINSEDLIEIVLIGDNKAALYSTRIKLVKGTDVECINVMITHIGGAGATCFSMVEVAENSGQINIIKRQMLEKSAQHYDIMAFDLSGEANAAIYQINIGAAKGRNGIYGNFSGSETNSHLDLYGITLAGDQDHMDTTFVLDHAVPNCTSAETFKNVIGGKAKAVFQGKIMVKPDAQKTDAQMMCQSLLVSEHAEVDVKPELEIFADDVQCGHGATMGDIDEDLLFYLRARGIPEAQARKMLMLAFLSEVFENLEDEALKQTLQENIESALEHVM